MAKCSRQAKNIRTTSLRASRAHIASTVIARRLLLHGLIQEANVNESTGFTKHMWLRRARSYFFPHTRDAHAAKSTFVFRDKSRACRSINLVIGRPLRICLQPFSILISDNILARSRGERNCSWNITLNFSVILHY